ncbi:phage tail tape measure protein [uncultured Anaerococcus sp.]|uniref:phage tail tape measure protein n=1 Tax=uncultured Anaerococcus sp. TaxID=293428 RepID=UPI0028893E2D|nr:phage tail tape measure protein [uncultured Anaerococcus sp.]
MASDGKLLFDTKLDTSGFKSGLASLSSMAAAAGNGFKNITGKALDGIKTGFKAAGVAAAGFGAYSLKAGADFEAAMSEVEAISGASGGELNALTNKAKEMGATTKFSATQSAEALKYMGMAGWKSQEMIDGLPGVINLAAASGEDLGVVSDIVTDSLTAFGLQAKDTGRFVDVLAATSTASNTNVSMLGESFKYVAPVAGALGYKVEDVSVALGLMANAGIKGSSGPAIK